MEHLNTSQEINADEIGHLARLLDSEMTVIERMKLKKSSLIRIAIALAIYVVTMVVFTIIF